MGLFKLNECLIFPLGVFSLGQYNNVLYCLLQKIITFSILRNSNSIKYTEDFWGHKSKRRKVRNLENK